MIAMPSALGTWMPNKSKRPNKWLERTVTFVSRRLHGQAPRHFGAAA
jgi:hypothetical protein